MGQTVSRLQRFGSFRVGVGQGNGRTLDFGPAKNGPPATVPTPQLAHTKSIRSRSSARNTRLRPMSSWILLSTCSGFQKKNTFLNKKQVFCSLRANFTRHPSSNHPFFILDQQKLWTSFWEGCQWTAPTETSVCLNRVCWISPRWALRFPCKKSCPNKKKRRHCLAEIPKKKSRFGHESFEVWDVSYKMRGIDLWDTLRVPSKICEKKDGEKNLQSWNGTLIVSHTQISLHMLNIQIHDMGLWMWQDDICDNVHNCMIYKHDVQKLKMWYVNIFRIYISICLIPRLHSRSTVIFLISAS